LGDIWVLRWWFLPPVRVWLPCCMPMHRFVGRRFCRSLVARGLVLHTSCLIVLQRPLVDPYSSAKVLLSSWDLGVAWRFVSILGWSINSSLWILGIGRLLLHCMGVSTSWPCLPFLVPFVPFLAQLGCLRSQCGVAQNHIFLGSGRGHVYLVWWVLG